jgi:hypothetical protein
MSLIPIANPAQETIRGVRFSMLDGTFFVSVLVTHGALNGIEPSEPGSLDHLTCFRKHRRRLEHLASLKYDRGELEENGSVLVEASDVRRD